ncbi:MAG: hypothetical protein PHS98_03160 [Bacilli bacterium]|nr:hypothetical protein [Bacilli bacterium]
MKKKTILLIVIAVLLIGLGIVGVTNKTFFKTYYETTNEKKETVKIPLPLFSYFESESGEYTATFKTLRSVNSISNKLNKHIENLTSCYDESYFYDEKLGITISQYSIENGFPFNKIILAYKKGDYCENQYVLDNNWMTEIKENATIKEVIITKCSIKDNDIKYTPKTITNYDIERAYNYINKSSITRIENKNNITNIDEDDSYTINVHYTIDNFGYELIIFSYDTNYLAFKVIDSNDHAKNAVYNMNTNSNHLLKQLWEVR